jgi:hypothetical protein
MGTFEIAKLIEEGQITPKEFRPTQFDHHYAVKDRENWFLAPVSRNRDSDALTRSNWNVFCGMIGEENEETYEIHRFGHWGPGWFEIILINPENKKLVTIGEEIENALADYPVIDDEHFSCLEYEEACEVWEKCYTDRERIEYIRKNRNQFEFNDFNDLLTCVRGKHFSGYASELLG